MATKGERQALYFLAAVALLGAGTRWYRSRRPAAEAGPLQGQLSALDSAGHSLRDRKSGKQGRPRPSRDSASALDSAAPPMTVDLDYATRGAIEKLPGVGPSLATRIVANRDSSGPFGCLIALDSVKGIGPAMLKRLDSLVTFTGPARAVCLQTLPPPGEEDQQKHDGDGDGNHGRKKGERGKGGRARGRPPEPNTSRPPPSADPFRVAVS